jgi:hypothetical protein
MNIDIKVKKFIESKEHEYNHHGLSKVYQRTGYGEPAYYFMVKDEVILSEERDFWVKTISQLENFEGWFIESSVGTQEKFEKELNFGWKVLFSTE